MSTHLEYALMAQDTYNLSANAKQIPNWNRLTDYTYEPVNQWGLGVVVSGCLVCFSGM